MVNSKGEETIYLDLDKIEVKKEPWGYRRIAITPENMSSKRTSLGLAVFMPHQSLGEHWHDFEEEILYILRGRGVIGVEKDSFSVKVNSIIYIPVGKKHFVKNIGNEDLWLLSIRGSLK